MPVKPIVTIADIDVFIVTHNRANLIRESIRSILNQSVLVSKITVLDNESTDNTRDVVLSFAHNGVQYVKTSGNFGNFKKIQEISNSKYLIAFHDDDILHSKYFEIVLAEINSHSDVSLITTGYTAFQNTPKIKHNIKYETLFFSDCADFAAYMYFWGYTSCAPTIYKSESFKKFSLNDEKFSKFNDWPFMVQVASTGTSVILKTTDLYYYREHPCQDTNNKDNTVSITQIVNWDKFFYDIMKERMTDYEFFIRFIERALYFSEWKFRRSFDVLANIDELYLTMYQAYANERPLFIFKRYLEISRINDYGELGIKGVSICLFKKLMRKFNFVFRASRYWGDKLS